MFDPSIQLLLACATPSTDGAQIAELLSRSIDWELVLEQARWHCVLPLVYRSLHADAGGLVPQAVLTAAQASFEENFHRNLFFSAQMIRLADGFRERNIPAVAYKGPVLCTYYGQLGLREFGDLDFLVAPKDVAGADDYLRQEGFHPHLYEPCAQEPRSLPFARAFHYELVYTNASSETKVDLHWALMPGFWPLSDDAAEVWMHRRTISLGGGRFHPQPRRYALAPLRTRHEAHVEQPRLDLRRRRAPAFRSGISTGAHLPSGPNAFASYALSVWVCIWPPICSTSICGPLRFSTSSRIRKF